MYGNTKSLSKVRYKWLWTNCSENITQGSKNVALIPNLHKKVLLLLGSVLKYFLVGIEKLVDFI